jgi:cell volume regulation protein A
MADAIAVFSIAGTIIVIGFLANVLFKKTGLPDTLFLILIGIVLGPILGVFPQEGLLSVMPFFTTLTLMIILFEGGLNMDIYKVVSGSFRAAILSVLYVLMATVFIPIFGYFVLKLEMLEALILAPMTAGTSSVVIIPLMSKLRVDEKVGVTLSLESAITDVLNIVLVLTFLQMYLGSSMNFQQTVSTIVARFSIGIIFGFIAGIVWVKILGIVRKQEYTYMLSIAALIICYVASEYLGGSSSLAAFLFGLVLGNYGEIHKIFGGRTDLGYMSELMKTLKNFQGEIAFLIRAFFFVFLGLVYMPYWLGVLYAVVIVSVNLVFRYTAVTISTYKSGMYEHRKFMTLMCGTGLANATISVMVYNALTALTIPVPHAYMYPLIVTNIIIINNMITVLIPALMKMKLKNQEQDA